VVYRDGLENRYGLTAIGGSNPSPSAKAVSWKDIVDWYVKLGIWAGIVGALFAFLWRKGYLLRVSNYVLETREELKKCTWPSVDELKGSTVVVMITLALLGGFTVGVDFVVSYLIRLILG
jgi:preprotein translocase subunit SecE